MWGSICNEVGVISTWPTDWPNPTAALILARTVLARPS
jgi:hypothetical protein